MFLPLSTSHLAVGSPSYRGLDLLLLQPRVIAMWSALFLFLLPFLAPAAHANNVVSCYRPIAPVSFPGSDVALRSTLPTTYYECFQVVKFLVRHERTDLPLMFSRVEGRGYLVPETWCAFPV